MQIQFHDYNILPVQVTTSPLARPVQRAPKLHNSCSRVLSKRDCTRAENRFRLSPKWTSPFKSAGASVQSAAGSRGVRISVSNAGYTTFRGSVRVLAIHSIRQFPLHFSSLRHRVPSGFNWTLPSALIYRSSFILKFRDLLRFPSSGKR
jgi:hypothetical protein